MLKLFILIASIQMLASCTRLANTKQDIILTCGAELPSSTYIQILRPNGSPWSEATQMTAEVVATDGKRWPLSVSPKHCVSYPAEALDSPQFLLIRAADQGAVFYAFSPMASLKDKATLNLQVKTRPALQWECPGPEATAQPRVELPLQSASTLNPYIFRYKHQDGREHLILGPQSLSLETSSLPEGAWTFQTALFDVMDDPDLQQAIAQKNCTIHIDRVAPSIARLTFLPSGTSLFSPDFYEISEDQILSVGDMDGTDTLFYCLSPLDEQGRDLENRCENSKNFHPLEPGVRLARTGLWKFFYFTQDVAGNRSATQQVSLVTFNGERLDAILILIKLARNPQEKIDDRIVAALKALVLYNKLGSRMERDRVATQVKHTILVAASLFQSQRAMPLADADDFSMSQDGKKVFSITGSTRASWNAASLVKAGEQTFDGAALRFIPHHDDFLALRKDRLEWYDGIGGVRAVVPLTVEAKIQTIQGLPGSAFVSVVTQNESLIFDHGALVSRQALPTGFQSLHVDANGHVQTLVLQGNSLIIDEGAKGQKTIDVSQFVCRQGEPVVGARWSPKANFIVLESTGSRGFFDREGKLAHPREGVTGWSCQPPNSYYAFTDNDRFLVQIRGKRDLSVYDLKTGKTKQTYDYSFKNDIKLTAIRNSSSLIFTLGSREIMELDLVGYAKSSLSTSDAVRVLRSGSAGILAQTAKGLMVWNPEQGTGLSRRFFDSKRQARGFVGPGMSLLRYTLDNPIIETKGEISFMHNGTEVTLPNDWNGKTVQDVRFSPKGDAATLLFGDEWLLWNAGSKALKPFASGSVKPFWNNGQLLAGLDSLELCGSSTAYDFLVNDRGDLMAVSCKQSLVLAKNAGSGWSIVWETALEKPIRILGIGHAGLDVVGQLVDEQRVVWITGEKILGLDVGSAVFGGSLTVDDSTIFGAFGNGMVSLQKTDNDLIMKNVKPKDALEPSMLRSTYHPDIDAFVSAGLGSIQLWDRKGAHLTNYDFGINLRFDDVPDFAVTPDGLHVSTANAFIDLDFSIEGLRKSFCFHTPELTKAAGLVCP